MKLVCMNCCHEFDGTISKDELGWHSSCPECGSSFDVDVPKGKIVMAFAYDETDEYFTDDWYDDNEFITYYAFNTPTEFMNVWRKMHNYDNGGCPDSMWYWVLDNGDCICSGACDSGDEEIFTEHWNMNSTINGGLNMKTYKFVVSLCDGWCCGHLEFNAQNEDEAYDMAMDYVAEKLCKAFPTLGIDYNVECDNPDDDM